MAMVNYQEVTLIEEVTEKSNTTLQLPSAL